MIWLKGIIYKTQIPHAKACEWVFSITHGNPFNFDMTHLKPEIKCKNLVSISQITKRTTWVCIFLLERGLCLWAGWTPAWMFPPQDYTWGVEGAQHPFPEQAGVGCWDVLIAETRLLRMESSLNHLMKLPGLQQCLSHGGLAICVHML